MAPQPDPHEGDDFQSPFNKLPPVIVALAVIIGGLELLFTMAGMRLIGGPLGEGWRQAAIEDFGVFDQLWEWMVANQSWPWDMLRRFLTYPLIHEDTLSAVFVIVFVLAMGKMVGEVFNPVAVLAVFWLSAIVGALAYVTVLDEPRQLVGGFPGAYGLIGGFTFLLWANLTARGANQYRAFSLIAMLMAIHLGFAIFSGDFGRTVSDLGGFFAGFLISFVVCPGGWRTILAKLRGQ